MTLYNLRNPAVKRLMKEAEELRHPTDEYHAQPLEDNLFEWHFTLRGPPNSDYDGGIYHGRITLPPDYPMKPPSIILLTPNGRFEINKKICLSISGHHPESWQPSWSIRTALLAIIGFMPTHGNGAIGSLDYTPEERKQLALKSQEWHCAECGGIKNIFLKNKCHRLGDDSPAASSVENSEIDLNLSSSLSTLPNLSTVNEVPTETSSSEHSKSSVDDTSTVHRRNIAASLNEADEPKPTTSNSPKSNRFYVVCTWLIVLIIIFLCLRRLFSL